VADWDFRRDVAYFGKTLKFQVMGQYSHLSNALAQLPLTLGFGNSHRCLYEPLGDLVLVKGAGGRYGSRPPQFITARPSTQGAI
jgi:hypothetical protein